MDQPGGPDASRFEVVHLKGFDPVVVMAQLEAVLTGSTYDEVTSRADYARQPGQKGTPPDELGTQGVRA
ncbi:hypothetical protein ABH931_001237 [Streptacidiphilus sp. MAP12-33]|uniref:hypothetical protein n=1 Tax=Streptacidiphilus sp. MAP12-33 TaxID=3156266 RepID=UPI0035123D2A